MRHRAKKPTLQVKKETLRILQTRVLSDQQLGHVVGGWGTCPRHTQDCG